MNEQTYKAEAICPNMQLFSKFRRIYSKTETNYFVLEENPLQKKKQNTVDSRYLDFAYLE